MDLSYGMNEHFPPAMDIPSYDAGVKAEHQGSPYPNLLQMPQATVPASTHGLDGHWQASVKEQAPGNEGWTPYRDEKIRQTGQDCIYGRDAEIDTLTIFDSIQEAVEWRQSQSVSSPLEADTTIPETDEQKKACVKLLFKAWKSVADAEDNEKMQAAFKLQKHDNGRVEVVCWQILEALIRRAKTGSLLIEFDPAKNKDGTNMRTFLERFNEVITSLKSSKTIAKHLLDSPYINTFIDDPVGARGRVESNRKLNARKGETMRAGQQAQGHIPGSRRKSGKRARLRNYSAGTDTPESDVSTPAPQHPAASFTPSHTLVPHVRTGMDLTDSSVGHPMAPRFDGTSYSYPGNMLSYHHSPTPQSSVPVFPSLYNANVSNMTFMTRRRGSYGPAVLTTESFEHSGNIAPPTYPFMHSATALQNSTTVGQNGTQEPEIEFNVPESLMGNVGAQFSSGYMTSSEDSSLSGYQNFEQEMSTPSQHYDVPDLPQLLFDPNTPLFQGQFIDKRLYSSPTEPSSP